MAKKNLLDLIKALDLLEKEIIKEGPKISEEVAVNASALAIHRIQREGITGKTYSTNMMFATQSMFNRKAAFKPTEVPTKGKPGTTKKKKRLVWIKFKNARKAVPVMILPGGYKQFRGLNGLQSAHVDLTFTGRMFQNVKILQTKQAGAKFLSIVGVPDPENKAKFAGNRDRFGDFMAPTKEDQQVINTIPVKRLRTVIKKVLG